MSTSIFWLLYSQHEDEAEKTGMGFRPNGNGTVDVWTTYRGYPEAEKYGLKTMSTKEARELWSSLTKIVDPDLYDFLWIHTDICPSDDAVHPHHIDHGLSHYAVRNTYQQRFGR